MSYFIKSTTDFYSRVAKLWKTHSFASLTRSNERVFQTFATRQLPFLAALVRHRCHVLSV